MIEQQALKAAANSGFASHGIAIARLARESGVSESTVRRWSRGCKVSDESLSAIERALGIKRSESRRAAR